MAVVIVNYRTPELTETCLISLRPEKAALADLRVMVVDGGSGDDSAEKLTKAVESPEFRDWVEFVPLPINGGYGWANNQAIQSLMACPDPPAYIHILNPDTEIEPGAVTCLARYLTDNPSVGAVGSQLFEPDGNQSESAFIFPTVRGELSRGARTAAVDRLFRVPPSAISSPEATEVDWTTGASVMFRAAALRQVGLFDEGFFLYHEEVELMWRLRQGGWQVAVEPRSRVRHVGAAATGMHHRDAKPSMLPRRPRYWFRSRTRYFTLTRGRGFAVLVFFAWLFGYSIWFARRSVGLAPEGPPIDHGLRDHLANAFPRRRDAIPAVRRWDSATGRPPAWMEWGSV